MNPSFTLNVQGCLEVQKSRVQQGKFFTPESPGGMARSVKAEVLDG